MGGPSPILLSEYLSYAQLWGFSRIDAQETWETVHKIDCIWLEVVAKHQEAEAKSKQKAKK